MFTIGDVLHFKKTGKARVKGLIEMEQERFTKKKWMGTWPAECDLCKTPLSEQEFFVDGATRFGPWALMCPGCHISHGQGLGLGRGQKYDSKTLEKLDG